MITETMMSVTNTFKQIRQLGVSVSRTDGEWRICPKKGKEESAYYTNDNADAIATAKRMNGGL